ncbi:MAG TPA: hypothetical protein PKE29_14795 [Phycisphaerales bacterium]|nr:hypothetical protein [Phycisphaerales bacterium]
MPWFIIIVAMLILLFATPIALWWWRLVNKAAPYRDARRGDRGADAGEGPREIIITPPAGPPGSSRDAH